MTPILIFQQRHQRHPVVMVSIPQTKQLGEERSKISQVTRTDILYLNLIFMNNVKDTMTGIKYNVT